MRRIAIVFTVLWMTMTLSAQDNLAAIIEVRHEGVEVRRDNSELWLGLPLNAIAFIGLGDTVRTDSEGRVDIRLDETSHILLLSNSDFTMGSLSINQQAVSMSGMVNGNAIFDTSADTKFDSFEIQLNDMLITRPADLMGIWSFVDARDAVTIAEGVATVLDNDTLIDIPAESGYIDNEEGIEAIAFDPEWHAAGLETILFGCEGEVQTIGAVPLLVRTGPGSGFLAMGTLDVSRIVSLMGVTETTGWTRIQFLTGFGWIQSRAVESDCTDIPLYPDDAPQEKFVTVVNVRESELTLIQPFFMTPANNAFSYRFAPN